MQEGLEGNPMAKTMKNFSRVLALLTVPFTASFPKVYRNKLSPLFLYILKGTLPWRTNGKILFLFIGNFLLLDHFKSLLACLWYW